MSAFDPNGDARCDWATRREKPEKHKKTLGEMLSE